jgi:hypothetical protein
MSFGLSPCDTVYFWTFRNIFRVKQSKELLTLKMEALLCYETPSTIHTGTALHRRVFDYTRKITYHLVCLKMQPVGQAGEIRKVQSHVVMSRLHKIVT